MEQPGDHADPDIAADPEAASFVKRTLELADEALGVTKTPPQQGPARG